MDAGFDTKLVRINRPDFVSDLTPEQLNHPSETAMDAYPADIYIANNGTLDDLYDAGQKAIEHIG